VPSEAPRERVSDSSGPVAAAGSRAGGCGGSRVRGMRAPMQTTCRRAAMKRIFSTEVSNATTAARQCISPTPAPLNLGISS
jgi:hypothetical protein